MQNNNKPDLSAADYVLDGMPNLHSHAFQRAMAGLTEHRGSSQNDSFWTWRALMYQFSARLQPDDLKAVATWLYIEMLKAGYTHVGEFHYLHHQPDGNAYGNPGEMAHALLEAAREAGIGITLLPVFYAASDFGGVAPTEGQRRFTHSPEAYLKLLESLRQPSTDQGATLGIALHSLRACPPVMLREVLGGVRSMGLESCPKHIHIAEQRKEVEGCMNWSGKRPVEWLLDHEPVDESWCLVHATHLSEKEVEEMAASGAVAGLCPTTEANLGDGIFPAVEYLPHGGRFGIGSDSHISVNAAEELRLLEYSQRLRLQARTVLSDDESCGHTLWHRAVSGGKQALGVTTDSQLTLSLNHPLFARKEGAQILDTAIFALPTLPIEDVWVNGTQVLEKGHHAKQEQAAEDFRETLSRLGAML